MPFSMPLLCTCYAGWSWWQVPGTFVVSILLSCWAACPRRYLTYALLLLLQKNVQLCLTVLNCDFSPADMSSPSQPPPGGNQSQNKALMGVTIAMLSFSTIFVSLRFLVRIYVVKSIWWDDWTILLALVSFMRSLCFNAKFNLAGHGSRRRIGHCRISLWLRSPSILHR